MTRSDQHLTAADIVCTKRALIVAGGRGLPRSQRSLASTVWQQISLTLSGRSASTTCSGPGSSRAWGSNLVLTGEWLDPAEDENDIARIRSTFEAVEPRSADAMCVNYLTPMSPTGFAPRTDPLGAARNPEAYVGP